MLRSTVKEASGDVHILGAIISVCPTTYTMAVINWLVNRLGMAITVMEIATTMAMVWAKKFSGRVEFAMM